MANRKFAKSFDSARKSLPPRRPGDSGLRKVGGVNVMWIPNPMVKNGGYWRRIS